ncbi:MAG: hypothetical protein KatS3mg084_0598 [Candidatus Dojkabacteria bacterium]|nr:MAG: hypothetical protein KatS3mg084_0598 [Candidatus Dojkabacteria bacterium]
MRIHISKYSKYLLLVIFNILACLGITPTVSKISTAYAYSYGPPVDRSSPQAEEIARRIYNSGCPDVIKNIYITLDGYGNPTLRPEVSVGVNGSVVYGYQLDSAGNPINPVVISCASASTLQKIIVRIVMILYAIVGLVLAFSIGKAAVLIMTAGDNTDKRQTAVKGLVASIVSTFGFLFAYPVLVFFLVGVLGFGVANTERKEYNFICQNTIVFNLTFDRNDPCGE